MTENKLMSQDNSDKMIVPREQETIYFQGGEVVQQGIFDYQFSGTDLTDPEDSKIAVIQMTILKAWEKVAKAKEAVIKDLFKNTDPENPTLKVEFAGRKIQREWFRKPTEDYSSDLLKDKFPEYYKEAVIEIPNETDITDQVEIRDGKVFMIGKPELVINWEGLEKKMSEEELNQIKVKTPGSFKVVAK